MNVGWSAVKRQLKYEIHEDHKQPAVGSPQSVWSLSFRPDPNYNGCLKDINLIERVMKAYGTEG